MTTPESFAPGYRLTDGNQLNFRIANPQWSTTSSVSATPGGTMGTSAKVVNAVTNITNASVPGAGITLPQALEGTVLLVSNNSGNDVRIFADGGSDINGLDGQIGVLLAKGTTAIFTAVATKQWNWLNTSANAGVTLVENIAALRGTTVNLYGIMFVEGYYAVGDGGGGYFYGVTGAAPGTYVDNGGSVILPTGGNGSSAWLRIFSGSLNVRWFGAKGNGASASPADDTAAIQAAINQASVDGNVVFIPTGQYNISATLQYPTTAGSYSVQIIGEKSEAAYDWIPGAYSTVIKATAAMDAVFNARLGFTQTSSTYSKLNNVAVNGNGLAQYGYVNGYQDTVQDCTFFNCAKSGIYLGDFTNSSLFTRVTCIANQEWGAVLTGEYSTVSVWNECKLRGNGSGGAIIYSAISATFTNCIFENNNGCGLEFYTITPLPNYQILNLQFNHCYFEQNNVVPGVGYEIIISGDGGTAPSNIVFSQPEINSGLTGKTGVQIQKGTNIYFYNPLLTGEDITVANWFFVGSEATNVTVTGLTEYLALSYMGTGGSGIQNVIFSGPKGTNSVGTYQNNTLQANIISKQYNFTTNQLLTPVQVSGSVLSNLGQSAQTAITLPSPVEGYSFTAIITETTSAAWIIAATDAGTILLNGTTYTSLSTTPVVGAAVRFTAVTGSSYLWLAEVIHGTWIGA